MKPCISFIILTIACLLITGIQAQEGIWTNVTPSGLSLNYNDFNQSNYGLQDVIADPVRKSDIYAFTTYQGVWKSTDYGLTWAKVSLNGGPMDLGRAWGEAIEKDPNRDPSRPPRLYACQGYGPEKGLWYSIDGGVNWSRYALPSGVSDYPQDIYSIDTDPYDVNHIIVGYHERPGVMESTDGGQTWRNATGNNTVGKSWYLFFIDNGDSATTRKTWLALPQSGDNSGVQRTTNAGATWTKVENGAHPHGNCQIYQPDKNGAVYMAGINFSQGNGVYRSVNYGETWTHVSGSVNESGVWGTPTHIYATYAWACGGCSADANFLIAPPGGATGWAQTSSPMTRGAKRAAVTYDGRNYIIVTGCWNAGIWRYVEPASGTNVKKHQTEPAAKSMLRINKDNQMRLYDLQGKNHGMISPQEHTVKRLLSPAGQPAGIYFTQTTAKSGDK